MNEIINKELNIEDMIYEIREKQVMLDSDLAKLYGIETKRINEAVRNNPYKFPDRFIFVLDDHVKNYLRSKFSTTNISNMSRSNPRVFTEQDIIILSGLLKSDIAVEINIKIINAGIRTKEDLFMLKKFWPTWIAKIINRLYKNAEKNNRVN